MGTICILLGLIIFILFALAGVVASNAILSNITMMSLFSMGSNTQVYLIIVGICAGIGLLICLNLVMHGLTYNKAAKTAEMVKKLLKRSGK